MPTPDEVLQREIAYHEKLYGGFAQQHFAKAAVRELRAHMVRRMVEVCRLGPQSRVLSLGCGIGDTELLLAREVGEVIGVDLSPSAVRQANQDAAEQGITNARFLEGTIESDAVEGRFDAIGAIFLLHHLPDDMLARAGDLIRDRLSPGGYFYSLDPSRQRLSGKVGELLFPQLMRKYQSPDEHELDPEETRALFERPGFHVSTSIYDFGSSPLAGLFPSWATGYRAARWLDDAILRVAWLRWMGSNFELIGRRVD